MQFVILFNNDHTKSLALLRYFLLGLLCLFPLVGLTQDAIPDFSANYLIRLNGIQAGELKRQLVTQQDGVRLFQSRTQAKGVFAFFKPEVVTESSLWSWQQQTMLPLHYRYQRQGGHKDKTMLLDFDWSNQQLHIDDKQQPWSLPLTQPTLDKLLYQLTLMSDLAKGKQAFDYVIADGGKLKQYHITQIARETIRTPLGEFDTIKLTRQRDRANDRKTTLWCAPALHFLPVMLEHIEKDGSEFTAVIRRLKGIDLPANATLTEHTLHND